MPLDSLKPFRANRESRPGGVAMAFRFDETARKLIVYFTDAVILSESQEFVELCQRATSAGKKVIIDFRGVQFMSSAMIGFLVLVNKLTKQHNVEFRLANVSPNVMEVFKITKLHKVFRFDNDDDDEDRGP